MKFLVLALCVCAASAASFGSAPFGAGGYKAYKGFQNTAAAPAVFTANAAAAPAVFAANAAAAPAVFAANAVAAPAVYAAKTVASVAAPVVVAPVAAAAAATYQAGSTTYQAAKQVVNKAYGSEEGQAAILRSESDVSADGYKFAYETANGISAEAVGTYKQVGETGAVVSQGAYRYNAPDGTPVIVTYTADENGYQPQSDLLPVGPAIPEAIVRSLAYIAAHTKDAVQKY